MGRKRLEYKRAYLAIFQPILSTILLPDRYSDIKKYDYHLSVEEIVIFLFTLKILSVLKFNLFSLDQRIAD